MALCAAATVGQGRPVEDGALPALPAYWGLATLTRARAAQAAAALTCAALLVAATTTLPLVFP